MATIDNMCEDCPCDICSGIRTTVDKIYSVLRIHGWMLDTYVVDFFQEDLWLKLPNVWRNFLDEITPEELGKWLLGESVSKRVWPLSLLALRKFIEQAEICRDHKKQSILKCTKYNKSEKIEEGTKNSETQVLTNKREFNNLFTKHVKKKKRYEIDVLSQITADSAKKAECQCIVDVGSGMCHLARVLAYQHDLCVTCIEQNQELLQGARKWDEQLTASLSKHIPNFCKRKPQYVSLQVGVSYEDRKQLADRLTSIFAKDFGVSVESSGFGIIGLHPCGDLAATLLRFYSAEEKARFICIVGCCYMKLTLGEGSERGFPMSRYFTVTHNNYEISYAALEVACHAIEKHCDKLKTNNYADLKVHGYRAVLEYLLIEKNPNLRRTQLKSTKIKEDTTFEKYCEVATEYLDEKDCPINIDFERKDVKDFLQQWKRVLMFGSLRLLLARLVETLVLFDRFLYLSEQNLSPSLKAGFDSRVSPRNILLVSIKKNTGTIK